MVQKIASNLGLPEISEITYINEVATEEEMQTARHIRVTEGKHVIPVPTFEIKKDFSGYLLDPLQIFKTKGRGKGKFIYKYVLLDFKKYFDLWMTERERLNIDSEWLFVSKTKDESEIIEFLFNENFFKNISCSKETVSEYIKQLI